MTETATTALPTRCPAWCDDEHAAAWECEPGDYALEHFRYGGEGGDVEGSRWSLTSHQSPGGGPRRHELAVSSEGEQYAGLRLSDDEMRTLAARLLAAVAQP